MLPCKRPRFDSPWRSYQQISLPPRAARPTQPSILPRSVNEYGIIPGLTLGHRRWGLLPSTTTGGMTDGYIPTIPSWWVAPMSTQLTEPRFSCAQLVSLHVFTTLEFESNYLTNLLWKIVKSRDHNKIKPPIGKIFRKYESIRHHFAMPQK